jgi:hypothetical protein
MCKPLSAHNFGVYCMRKEEDFSNRWWRTGPTGAQKTGDNFNQS